MPKKSTSVKFVLLFSLTLFFVATSVVGRGLSLNRAQAQGSTKAKCSKETDVQIRKEIIESLRAKFPAENARKEALNFNVTCKGKVVKLTGGVQGGEIYLQVIDVVQRLKNSKGESVCLSGIDVRDFFPVRRQSCDPATERECNGGCIPKSSQCHPIG